MFAGRKENFFILHLHPFMMHIDDRNSFLSPNQNLLTCCRSCFTFYYMLCVLKERQQILSISNYNFKVLDIVSLSLAVLRLMTKDFGPLFECLILLVIKCYSGRTRADRNILLPQKKITEAPNPSLESDFHIFHRKKYKFARDSFMCFSAVGKFLF